MTFLVLCLNSLGNIAMTVPIIHSASKSNPAHRFIVVNGKDVSCFYHSLTNVIPVHAKVYSNTIKTAWHLYRLLNPYQVDAVIDLQNNHYTRLLRMFFFFKNVNSFSLRIQFFRRMWLCLFGYRKNKPLLSTFDNYRSVFMHAGLHVNDNFVSLTPNTEAQQELQRIIGKKQQTWVGIAPFAKYASNQLPYRIMKEIISDLSQNNALRIFLFGGGKIEREILNAWSTLYPHVTNVAYRFPLAVELELMRKMDLMVCMDSANQHLAKLVNARVITIWCATHEYAGFACWKQLAEDRIFVPNLACRPCTINGKSSCRFNNYACKKIKKEDILLKIYSSLNL